MLEHLDVVARQAAPTVAHWAVRGVVEHAEDLTVRQGVAQAPQRRRDAGVMVTVIDRGGLGYAATSDASEAGLRAAFGRARDLAHAVAGRTVFDYSQLPASHLPRPLRQPQRAPRGQHRACVSGSTCWAASMPPPDWTTASSTGRPACGPWTSNSASSPATVPTPGSTGTCVIPNVQATAQVKGITQTRSAAGQYNGFCQQGGLEVLERAHFATDGPRVAREAIELALAPQCPSGTMDVLLMPDQMMLQIHESIGHPLELDRILGDERNFAGTSFVTLDMFGHYAYGSELLNVSYDPSRTEQLASFAFDDDGAPAERQLHHRAGPAAAAAGRHRVAGPRPGAGRRPGRRVHHPCQQLEPRARSTA